MNSISRQQSDAMCTEFVRCIEGEKSIDFLSCIIVGHAVMEQVALALLHGTLWAQRVVALGSTGTFFFVLVTVSAWREEVGEDLIRVDGIFFAFFYRTEGKNHRHRHHR